MISNVDAYATTLASLTGTAFQAEVCARLQSVVLGFQTIPSKPHGDAGLDGFSHVGTQGYCCYGPELKAYRQTRSLEKAIVDKFKSDLRRLLELEFKKTVLTCCENPEMATILPTGKKLMHVDLVVNWFESHRVVGPIHTALLEYKQSSTLRYVDANATIAIIGPTELANRWSVDELTLVRAQQKIFYGSMMEDIAAGEVARLIGECSIGWSRPGGMNAN